MKKAGKRVLSGIVCIVLALCLYLGSSVQSIQASVANNASVVTKQTYTEQDANYETGTVQNPFTVLEIVPNHSMAKIGYLIPGCEPIDMNALMTNDTVFGTYQSMFTSNNPDEEVAVTVDNVDLKKFADQIPAGATVQEPWADQATLKSMAPDANWSSTYSNYGMWLFQQDGYQEEGYYQYVEDGTGYFELKSDSQTGSYEFVYDAAHKGNYNWVEAENITGIATDYTADKVWTTRSYQYYFKYTGRVITNNDVIIKNVFDTSSAEGFVSQVITLTPEELTTESNLKLIDSADMIVIGQDTESDIRNLWNTLHDDGLPEVSASAPTRFNQNDVPWTAVKRIVERMASDNPAAIVLDKTTYDGNGSTNLKKLAIMLLEYDPALFVDYYFDKIDTNGTYTDANGNTHTEWVCSENASQNTFDLSIAKNKNINLEGGMGIISDNIYSYNGYNVFTHGFNQAKYTETNLNKDAFDYFEEMYGERPLALSAREYVQYILGGYKYKTTLRILEVEPTNAFVYPGDDHIASCTNANCAECQAWTEYYRKLFSWMKGDMKELVNSGRLQITTMPSWEFIGKIEDINAEYDMIIFGPNQNEANGVNGYNDSLMNGLIYSSIGDVVAKDGNASHNRQYNDYYDIQSDTTLRYSGNDLTLKKYEEVKNFLSGGKPVIVDSKFYVTDNTGTSTDEVNKVTVDENSYAYQLFSLVGTEQGSNMFVTDRIDMVGLKALLSRETCELEFYTADGGTGYPVEYTYTEKSDGSINGDTVTYVDSQTFAYQFRINGKPNQTYGVSLYIDRNGDGIYKGSLKENVLSQSDESEEVENLTITDMYGYPADVHNLQEGVWYRVSKELPENYVGILPWKLEVYDTTNPMIRDNVIKYSAIKTTSENREKIKVLQMNLTPNMTTNNSGVIMATVGFENDKNAQKFRKYLGCVNDFDVTVEFLTNDAWMRMFSVSSNASESEKQQKAEAWKTYLDGYDMLMIGFQDVACFTSNEVYQEGFEYFVDQGKSVILSHDLAKDGSYQYLSKSYVSTYDDSIRDLMRQRRYNTGSVMMQGRVIPLFAGDGTTVRGNLGRINIASITTENANGELIPNYGDNSTDLFVKYGPRIGSKNEGAKADRNAVIDSSLWFPYLTNYVNINNSGQITNYPYDIPDVIEVASTHNQYGQLNLDDEDMVVWYSLTDKYTKTYADEVKSLGGGDYSSSNYLGRGIYSSRESDIRNGYYIYNVGNITYTGMGHSGYNNTSLPDDEVKLFVNTMISAYRASSENPYVEVTNEDRIENSKNDVYLYVPVDDQNFNYTNANYEVDLKITDPSWLQTSEKETYLQFTTDATGATQLTGQPTLYGAGTTTPVATETIVMSSQSASTDRYVYFNKFSGWGDTVYCYVYSASNSSNNNGWKQAPMEKLSNGQYRYKIPSSISDPLIMFANGSSNDQYPASQQPGLQMIGTSMILDGPSLTWKTYTDGTETTNVTGQAYKVVVDGNYYFNVSYQELINKGQLEYYLSLRSITQKNGKSVTNKEVTKVTILPMPLFDLN